MRLDSVPPQIAELARQHGIDPVQLEGLELSEADLEQIIGGKGPVYVGVGGGGWGGWGPGWGWGGWGPWPYWGRPGVRVGVGVGWGPRWWW
jgi:hypothetical protein